MVALMAKSTKLKPASSQGRRAEGTKDVFARLDEVTVDRLDKLVSAMQPRTTRSAVIAHLIERFVSAEWPKHEGQKKSE